MTTESKPKLRVLLAQLPVPNNPALNVPLALGYLKAYAFACGLLEHVAIELLPRSLADHAGDALLVDEIVARRPDVLGMSLYTWNSERSLDIARRVAERLPELRVVVGGPEVQRDNLWVLEHPAVTVAVIGEGEQTFAELLRLWSIAQAGLTGDSADIDDGGLAAIPGIAFRRCGVIRFTKERVALSDLANVPSPYLLGYLEAPAGSVMMIEVSRWCPYACSFCLYGRNMGAKLGNRYFGLQRVVDEIHWARERGITQVHFVEANLNLVPLFWPLMRALSELNADHRMTFYAELRGEHLSDEVVVALDRANVRYVEVGLQTANPVALRASHRRTDLRKWAAGTRRLYQYDIEVYLDVILGLPEDDAAGVRETLDFIQREQLGSYDVFTLQVLPATAVREQAARYGLRYQPRPPYYVLATNHFSYPELRRLRRELKLTAGLEPDVVEGVPLPRRTALNARRQGFVPASAVAHLWLPAVDLVGRLAAAAAQLASHVDILVDVNDLEQVTAGLAECIECNPSSLIDLYLLCHDAPDPGRLRSWRNALPYQPGYLDRVAAYSADDVTEDHWRVSPRCFVVLPWTAAVDPKHYRGTAAVIWRFELMPGEPIPFGAWRVAGGAGIWLETAPDGSAESWDLIRQQIQEWEQATGRMVWLAEELRSAERMVNDELTVYSGRI